MDATVLKIDGRDLARARDEYFASEEGKGLLNPSILLNPKQVEFLKNRLEMAFLAGAHAAEKLCEAEVPKLGGHAE